MFFKKEHPTESRDFFRESEYLRGRLRTFLSICDEEGYGRLYTFLSRLEERHPDARDYIAFHIVAGSSPERECTHFDFSDPDSVGVWIEKEILEASKKKPDQSRVA